MRVSAKAEYACIAMLELALSYGEPQPVRVKAIAEAHGIPQRFLVQILLQLKGAGLVVSLRGAAGGYQLARSPRDIRLADIVNLIDRPAPARPGGPTLSTSRAMEALRTVWRRVQSQEQRLLEEVTLADLVRDMQQTSAPSYQI
jgi:Rrf2 family cysteine metabolism transcriptional repressor